MGRCTYMWVWLGEFSMPWGSLCAFCGFCVLLPSPLLSLISLQFLPCACIPPFPPSPSPYHQPCAPYSALWAVHDHTRIHHLGTAPFYWPPCSFILEWWVSSVASFWEGDTQGLEMLLAALSCLLDLQKPLQLFDIQPCRWKSWSLWYHVFCVFLFSKIWSPISDFLLWPNKFFYQLGTVNKYRRWHKTDCLFRILQYGRLFPHQLYSTQYCPAGLSCVIYIVSVYSSI